MMGKGQSRRGRLVAGAAALAVLATASSAQAATVTVCAGGGCDHTSVSAAVAAAAPNDTVSIAAGTYSQPTAIVVNKPLTITGAGSGQTIIDGGGTVAGVVGQLQLRTGANQDVSVSGLTIRNPIRASVTVGLLAKSLQTPSPTYTVTDVHIEGNGVSNEYGIWTENSTANLSFTGGAVSGTGANPILVEEPRFGIAIEDNDVARGTIGGGIFVMKTNPNGTGLPTVAQQRIVGNRLTGGAGISYTTDFSQNGSGGFPDVLIRDNTIEGAGIRLANNAAGAGTNAWIAAVVRDNTLTGNGAARGIDVQGLVQYAEIVGNDISGFGTGIDVRPAAAGHEPVAVEAHANRIVGNTAGLAVAGGATVDATQNWWGCNAGPGQPGCDTAGGGTTAPRLVLDLDGPAGVAYPAAAAFTASVDQTSAGGAAADPDVFPDGQVAFGATKGSIGSPQPLLDSVAGTSFSPPAENGDVTISATYDNQTVTRTISVSGAPLKATTLKAEPLLLSVAPLGLQLGTAQARLTETQTGTPLAGRTVVFQGGGTEMCRATTNANGVASCQATLGGLLAGVLNLGYTARFDGGPNHAPSGGQGAGAPAKAPLIKIGGLKLF